MKDSLLGYKVIVSIIFVSFAFFSIGCSKRLSAIRNNQNETPTPTPTPTPFPTPTPTPTPAPECSSDITASLVPIELYNGRAPVGGDVTFKLTISGCSGEYLVLKNTSSEKTVEEGDHYLTKNYSTPGTIAESIDIEDANYPEKKVIVRAIPFLVVLATELYPPNPGPNPVAPPFCRALPSPVVADLPQGGGHASFAFDIRTLSGIPVVIDRISAVTSVPPKQSEINSQLPTFLSPSHNIALTYGVPGQHLIEFEVSEPTSGSSRCHALIKVRAPYNPQNPADIHFTDGTQWDFGNVSVHSATSSKTMTIKNGGAAAGDIRALYITSNNTDYQIMSGNCRDLPVLVPNATCNVRVSFNPSQIGQRTATLRVNFYSNAGGNRYDTILLKGEGLQDYMVGVGRGHTCALKNGRVKCWGFNRYGQVGDGTFSERVKTPRQVSGLESGVTALAVGGWHNCVIKNGGVLCWGHNGQGCLGDGTNTSRSAPYPVSGLQENVTAIAAGSRSACAIQNGALKCWGYNRYGQLGDGTTDNRKRPVQVSGLSSGVTKVAMGADTNWSNIHHRSGDHACAIHNGALKCWGHNRYGQLGDGTTAHRHAPKQVSGLEDGVEDIALGRYFSFALMDDGRLTSWGVNGLGQLGNGSTSNRSVPGYVSGMNVDVTQVSGGGKHSCAVKNERAYCWGFNAQGQLGDNTHSNRSAPSNVHTLDRDMVNIAAGDTVSSCAFKSNGELYCWGLNDFGQLGIGNLTLKKEPVRVTGY